MEEESLPLTCHELEVLAHLAGTVSPTRVGTLTEDGGLPRRMPHEHQGQLGGPSCLHSSSSGPSPLAEQAVERECNSCMITVRAQPSRNSRGICPRTCSSASLGYLLPYFT